MFDEAPYILFQSFEICLRVRLFLMHHANFKSNNVVALSTANLHKAFI